MSIQNRRPQPDRQAGSAYLTVLLALVVLTILGLSLATVTTLEMEIGANERAVTRIFYGADSGVAIATAQALTSGEYRRRTVDVYQDTQTPPGTTQPVSRGFRLEVCNFIPILWEPCNWCPVNENEQTFYKVNHAATSTATELTWPGTATTIPNGAIPRGQKTVSVMVEVQPWWEPPPEALPSDATDLSCVRF